jgi:hypothetical protein
MPLESTWCLDHNEASPSLEISDDESSASSNDTTAMERNHKSSSKLDTTALKDILNDADVSLGGDSISNHLKGTSHCRQQLDQCRPMFRESDPTEQSHLVQSL